MHTPVGKKKHKESSGRQKKRDKSPDRNLKCRRKNLMSKEEM